jgi:hypothetical protein
MGTEEFLARLSRGALEAEAARGEGRPRVLQMGKPLVDAQPTEKKV